jgi:ABC-type transport system involved in multi-copper enzyme maturation permease subunit
MNLIRVWAIGSNSFREIIRERILYVLGLFGLMMVVAWRALPELAVGASNKILLDFGPAAITVLGVLITILVGTSSIAREIDRRTILVLIPKPLNRAEFILGKHLGLWAVMVVLVLAMAAINLIVLSLAKVSYPLVPMVVTNLFLLLELLVIGAAALLFGTLTSPLLATLLTTMLYFAGHGTQTMVRLTNGGASNVPSSPQVQQVTNWVYQLLPDLSKFDLKNDAVYGILPPSLTLWTSIAYGLLYTAIILCVAIAIFSRRQF